MTVRTYNEWVRRRTTTFDSGFGISAIILSIHQATHDRMANAFQFTGERFHPDLAGEIYGCCAVTTKF